MQPTQIEIVVRDYQDSDEAEWMRVHSVILSMSHAWNYSIQQRPRYQHSSVRLVAAHDNHIIGLMDVEIESCPGELCLMKDSVGGYVLEFGRLPEYAGNQIGSRLIKLARERCLALGVHRMEFWSQDPNAQRYYTKIGLPEINRHMRFRIKPSEEIKKLLDRDYIGCEYIYGACLLNVYPSVQQKYEIIQKHPLEPHLCIGYEFRF